MGYSEEIRHKLSTGNSTVALLGTGATFTGVWESALDYTSIAVSVLGTNATDGVLWFDVRKTGSTIVNSVPFFKTNITSNETNIPSIWNITDGDFRIRYVNGTTAQLTEWYLATKLSNGQQSELLLSAGGLINVNTPVATVKSVTTAILPSGAYANSVSTGIDVGNTTAIPLGIGSAFTGVWKDVSSYHGMVVSLTGTPGVSGTLFLEFSLDGINSAEGLGTSALVVNIADSTPRTAAKVAQYFRVRFVNGAVAQTTFYIHTTLNTQRIDLTATTNQLLHDNEDVRLVRTVSEYNTERNTGLLEHQFSKRKFGRSATIGTGSLQTVWTYSANWIPAQVAQPVRIKAGGNANDTTAGTGAQTVDVTFLDSNWNEVIETLVTNGALASASTSLSAFRVLSCKVRNVGVYHGGNIADIVIEQETSGNIMAHIQAEEGSTLQTVYTVPAGQTMYITEIFVSVGQADSCNVRLYEVSNADDMVTPFTAKHDEWGVSDFSGAQVFKQDTHLKFDEKTDVWFEAQRITGSGSARVSVDFGFYLKNN